MRRLVSEILVRHGSFRLPESRKRQEDEGGASVDGSPPQCTSVARRVRREGHVARFET